MEDLRSFMENPLINKLKDDPHWTVSDTQKRPVDANALMKGEIKLASFKDDNWPLTTLEKLNENSCIEKTNRAYRLHSEDNHVVCIDMEQTASPALRRSLERFPADYAEKSLSGKGAHFFIEIPDAIITDETRMLFEDYVVVKHPTGQFEVFFNDHYITMTGYMLPHTQRQDTDEHNAKLKKMLAELCKIIEERKNKNNNTTAYAPSQAAKDLTPYEKMLEEYAIGQINARSSFNIRSIPMKTLADFYGDHSRYELYLATRIAQIVVEKHQKMNRLLKGGTEGLKEFDSNSKKARAYLTKMKETEWVGWDDIDLSDDTSREHLAGIVYNIMTNQVMQKKHLLEHRKKHGEYRNGMPWLMDRAVLGTGYICKCMLENEQDC